MFLVKRIVGLRVLYIYSFAFNLVELGECTRIRGCTWASCERARKLLTRCQHTGARLQAGGPKDKPKATKREDE